MPANTPRGYTYPLYPDTQNFPAQIQDLAQDIDVDVEALENLIIGAKNRPSAQGSEAGLQSIAANVNVTLTFLTDNYDNDAMIDVIGFPTIIRLTDPGMYLLAGTVNCIANGNATPYSIAMTIVSSAGFIAIPTRTSLTAHQSEDTEISVLALHYTDGSVNDDITFQLRHNSAASFNVNSKAFSATKVSNLTSGT